VKRYPAYDPPEYVSWRPDPSLIAAFDAAIRATPERAKLVDGLDEAFLIELYAGLLRARLQDIALKRWVRTGVISKAWLGTGEEAATVGPVHALDPGTDIVAPMIRNAGACREMGEPIAEGFKSYLGTADSSSRGRDGHHGNMKYNILQPISHVGDMIPVVTGIALAMKLRSVGPSVRPSVALAWIGDGSVKAGATHEGFNFAAVQKVPAIFIVQDNRVALGTRFEQHHLANDFRDLPVAYGMQGTHFDGNNVLDAWAATKIAADRCRAGDGPVMLIAETFRMGGHATHDEREARDTFPAEWFAAWGAKDPVGLYEEWLKRRGVAESRLAEVEAGVEAEVKAAEEEALASREHNMPKAESALEGVYAN
jgi:TPP-dependent pyruvate/acetoin dehydrogenase alpha subunit